MILAHITPVADALLCGAMLGFVAGCVFEFYRADRAREKYGLDPLGRPLEALERLQENRDADRYPPLKLSTRPVPRRPKSIDLRERPSSPPFYDWSTEHGLNS